MEAGDASRCRERGQLMCSFVSWFQHCSQQKHHQVHLSQASAGSLTPLGLSACPHAIETEELMWAWPLLSYLCPFRQWQLLNMEPPQPHTVQTHHPAQPFFNLTGTNACTFPVTQLALVHIWQLRLQLFGNTAHVT